jgi:hypothetical protein
VLTATIASGAYTLSDLATAVQVAMLAAGALTYVVTVDDDNAFTIEAESAFDLVVNDNSLLTEMGFEAAEDEASYEGEAVETVNKEVTVTVVDGNDSTSHTKVETVQVISELADKLFSTDQKLRGHEYDIMKYLPEGRATFKDVHRTAQTLILAWLDTHGFIDNLGDKLTVASFTDRDEVTQWATHMALRLIFEGVHNAKDDVFEKKAKKYQGLEDFYRNRATIKVDMNQDGATDAVAERLDIRSCTVVRR